MQFGKYEGLPLMAIPGLFQHTSIMTGSVWKADVKITKLRFPILISGYRWLSGRLLAATKRAAINPEQTFLLLSG